MQRFSFIKGLVIAGVLSSLFWIGIYHAFTDNSDNPEEIETFKNISTPQNDLEVVATKASL